MGLERVSSTLLEENMDNLLENAQKVFNPIWKTTQIPPPPSRPLVENFLFTILAEMGGEWRYARGRVEMHRPVRSFYVPLTFFLLIGGLWWRWGLCFYFSSYTQSLIYHVSYHKMLHKNLKMATCTQIQKCVAVFATQKALNLPCFALQNATQTFEFLLKSKHV